ncbi:rod shape-determining protein MreD [Nocardioides carbamazepini]|uniref:rod shape-determining protein MreD n=1 Tax=Nocardioides carbamazepini TaxID=2854259 RepID=UPI002149F4DC|nr:rod shape-determining protein MreD [Nocardioides carbamazepini]MCR1782683.1 rod shape-determining protein MreD [Nocardioides carbamazepini]
MNRRGRLVATLVAVFAALLLQVTVLPHFAWDFGGLGVVPDLVLLVVVATAVATDTRFATLTGFWAGLLLDIAPPADHLAGRWALALMVVGYVVGRLVHDNAGDPGGAAAGSRFAQFGARRPPLPLALAAAAGGSFVGTSVFALSGVLLGDSVAAVGDLLPVALVALLLDVAAALVVVPATLWLVRRTAGDGLPRASQRIRVRA